MNKSHQCTIMRSLEIDAGHRLAGHEGKCKDLHGHRYKFEIYIQAEELDSIGRAIDFGKVKSIVGSWLDQNWDHGMIIWEQDELAYLWTDEPTGYWDADDGGDVVYGPLRHQKHFFLPENPTAENMASYLLTIANQLLQDEGIKVVNVVCWETPNCNAAAEL